MHLYKNKAGEIFAYSDEDLANLKASGINPIKRDKLKPVTYTQEELAEQQALQNKKILAAEARALLLDNEFRWTNKIKWERYDDKTRAAITKYYDDLVAVINGESETIPVLEI